MTEISLFTSMGHLIEAIGSPSYPTELAGLLRRAVPYSYTVVFGYLGAARHWPYLMIFLRANGRYLSLTI